MAKKTCAFFLVFFLWKASALADTNRFSVVKHFPLGGAGDLANTFGSLPLSKNKWRFLTELDYGYHPLQIIRGGQRLQGVVDHLLVQNFGISYAPSDFWQIDFDLPVVWANYSRGLAIPAGLLSNKTDVGDLQFRSRFTLFNRNENAVGLVLVPFLALPTGDEDDFAGENNVTGGLLVGIDRNFGNRVFLVFNAGVEGRERVRVFDLDMSARFLMSGGLGVRASEEVVIRMDVATATPFGHFFTKEVSSSTEANLGVDAELGKGFTINVGGAVGLVRGASQPLFATRAGLTFTPGGVEKKHLAKEPAKPAMISPVYFARGSKAFSKEAVEILSRAVAVISSDRKMKIVRVVGFADSLGHSAANRKLSLARAVAVADFLGKHGLDSGKIAVESRGEEGAGIGVSRNDRRVEIRIERK